MPKPFASDMKPGFGLGESLAAGGRVEVVGGFRLGGS